MLDASTDGRNTRTESHAFEHLVEEDHDKEGDKKFVTRNNESEADDYVALVSARKCSVRKTYAGSER